eukprot:symbB.v1.2.024677.t1/scaffold2350.1/size109873/7
MLGVSTDNEGKVAALLGNFLILACWLVERFWLSDAPLPAIQSAICVVIGLACSIIDWAGPTPYDDMRLGFASQTAGCDGGFRSPFVLYVSVWVTGLVFGTLLLFLEDGAIFSCGDRRPCMTGLPIRKKALPIVYGLATSMSCVLFATGSASNDMSWVTAGVLLLVISVLCSWDFLWYLDMNLATFGALFHGSATGLRAIQNHAIFRDLRWDPADAHGILVAYEYPGLQIFMFGLFLMFLSLQLYIYTCHWPEWKGNIAEESTDHVYDPLQQQKPKDMGRNTFDYDLPGSGSRWWQWILLPTCIICQIIGVHVPLIYTECVLPKLTWFHDDPDGYKVSEGESYIDVIQWLYQRKLPCSALVAAYNAMLLPPLQFLMIFLILLHPRFLPAELRKSMQNYVMTLAPMRFTQPSIMMLVVGVASLPMENQHPDNIQYGGHFTSGYWFFLTYCITNLVLAWSVQPPELPKKHEATPRKKLRRDPMLHLELKKHWQMEESDEHSDESLQGSRASLAVTVPLAMGVGIATCIWVALTNPYLEFEFRIAGVVIHRVTPTVLDLWYSIGSVNHFLMCYCAATLIVFPFFWLVLLCTRLASQRPGLEPVLRPYVMCHIWAASLVLIYYIVTARNKNTMEVCASFPKVPIAPVAIVLMGVGTFTLIHLAKALHHQMPADPASQMQLPLGGRGAMDGWVSDSDFWGTLLALSNWDCVWPKQKTSARKLKLKMPKSKRAKVVSLTKVKKRPKEKKDDLIEDIRDSCEKFSRVFLVSIENERNQFMQEIRKQLRPGKMVCTKNKIMQTALGTSPENECQDNIHKISQMISGHCALLFTNQSPEEVEKIFAEYRPSDYARSGSLATDTVTLPRGLEALAALPHSIEAHLRQLGLPTVLKEGQIHLLGEHTVCKAGQELSADAAQVLKLLNIKQAHFTLTVEAHWQKNGDFKDCSALED